MAANFQPVFALKPETKVNCIITAATTDKSGATTTNIKDLLTAATDGTKVTWIKFKHVGNSTAGIFLVWITDTAGANPTLFYEQSYTTITSGTTTATAEGTIIFNDLQLKSGQVIKVGATVYNTNIHVTASIGDFS